MSRTLKIVTTGPVTEIVLSRPDAGNALDAAMVEDLLAALDDLGEACRAVVFRGEGKGFCGGFDLSDLKAETDASLLWRFVRIEILLQKVATLPQETVAFAHRFAYGAGADLFAACRGRHAAPGTRFSFPGIRFGIALGTGRLARIAGPEVAREFLDAAAPIDCDAARQAGLVRDICAPEDVPDRIAQLAGRERALDPRMARIVADRIDPGRHAEDMAALVRSAAEPGLKDRIAAYAASRRAGNR